MSNTVISYFDSLIIAKLTADLEDLKVDTRPVTIVPCDVIEARGFAYPAVLVGAGKFESFEKFTAETGFHTFTYSILVADKRKPTPEDGKAAANRVEQLAFNVSRSLSAMAPKYLADISTSSGDPGDSGNNTIDAEVTVTIRALIC